MKPQHVDDGTSCPLWRKRRSKVCHTCAWYIQVRGKDPQTAADLDYWDCAIAFLPMLQIENAMVGRQTTATVDALRKEVQQSNDAGMANAMVGLNEQIKRLTPETPAPKLIGN